LAKQDWWTRHWDAKLAHDAVRRAIGRGDLAPQPCEECGERATVGHHEDYTKPLDVRWLCYSHHKRWHLAHPVTHEVPSPPKRAVPMAERTGPNRGKQFHRYLRPRARFLRGRGYVYQEIAAELGVSVSTAHAWCKDQ